MEITTTPSKEILNMITNEQAKRLKILAELTNGEMLIPMHTADMKIKTPQSVKIEKIILPPLIVQGRKLKNGLLTTSYLRYYVAYNVKPLPISHIYSDSGFICLGNLAIMPFIESQQILEPLELLLVNNDRIQHGRPHLNLSDDILNELTDYLKDNDIKIDIDLTLDWIENDTLWYISSIVYKHFNNKKRLNIMDNIYKIVFEERNDN